MTKQKQNSFSIEEIIENLDNSKATDILNIDLTGKSDICTHMIIASGTSSRHASSIAEKLVEFLKHDKQETYIVEGLDEGKWVLVECNQIIIHIFQPETREQYNLETLFAN